MTTTDKQNQTDLKLLEFKASLRQLSRDQLLDFAHNVAALEKRLETAGPKTDDELHFWIKQTLGFDIPRVSVCEGHDAPFAFMADLFFNRVNSALVLANRGGAKTVSVAILHLVNAKFKPGFESATVGAIEAQSLRCYNHLKYFIEHHGFKKEVSGDPRKRETEWKNGSKTEILAGTVQAVNGPHPNFVHFDEVELADPEVYDESRNMSMSSRGILAQDVITSTRKRGAGLMQKLIDENEEAIKLGHKPPFVQYSWCFVETAQNQPNCQVAYPDLSEDHRCTCDKVIKGKWDGDTPRRFSDVCRGRLAKAQGWASLDDLHKTFLADSRDMWEAQIECSKPSSEGLVVPNWNSNRHGIEKYKPHPEYGPIFVGIDFGGHAPHAVLFIQLLRREVTTKLFGSPAKITMRTGSFVVFDEIYRADIGHTKLADLIALRERYWSTRYGEEGFTIRYRFADNASRAGRWDLLHHDPPLPTHFYIKKEVIPNTQSVVDLTDEDKLFIDMHRCPNLYEEMLAWHYPRKRSNMMDAPDEPVDDFNHSISALKYTVCNVNKLESRNKIKQQRAGTVALPAAIERNGASLPAVANQRGPEAGEHPWGTSFMRP